MSILDTLSSPVHCNQLVTWAICTSDCLPEFFISVPKLIVAALQPAVLSLQASRERIMPQTAFLKDKFDLTPAEARLVVRLITGESLRPCAKVLGIKYETARTYLKSVFQKTKTHRQAQLVM